MANTAIAKAIYGSRDLRTTLERILRDDRDANVVIAASIPLMSVYGSEPAAQGTLLDAVDRLPDPVDKIRLLHSLVIDGVDAEQTVERLGRYLDGGPVTVQHQAAIVLLSAEKLPRDRFDDFLRLIETPETFADPTLLRGLPRFGVPPNVYLDRLLALQERLMQELRKPPEERSVRIYNDAFWKKTLDEAIATARAGTPKG